MKMLQAQDSTSEKKAHKTNISTKNAFYSVLAEYKLSQPNIGQTEGCLNTVIYCQSTLECFGANPDIQGGFENLFLVLIISLWL